MSRYATTNPATGETIREFPTMTDEEAQAAVARAAAAWTPWHTTPVGERAELLARVAELYLEHIDELAQLTTLEMGKPIAQARGEIKISASIYDYYATKGPDLLADEELDIAGSGRAVVRTAPIGPVLGIMPWNFPYYQVARFVAPNLLLGNTVILKHAGNCPQQALRMAELIAAARAPEGTYQNVFASNEQIADMIADPQLRGVSLTGSERAGSAVGAQAGKYLKKCVLELGGSDPYIVLPGADVDAAVATAVPARFSNAGQACTSAKRFIVADEVHDEFLEKFLARTGKWGLGDPAEQATRMGPMASVEGRDGVAAQVQDAVARGAVLHTGGEVPDRAGAWYPATVLTGLDPSMRAWREEVFGPVAMVHRVGSVDEAVELANDSPYGLGGTVFAADEATAAQVGDRLEVGMVGLNTFINSTPDMPFGGVKNSGIGRELGRYGIDEFSNKKLVRHM